MLDINKVFKKVLPFRDSLVESWDETDSNMIRDERLGLVDENIIKAMISERHDMNMDKATDFMMKFLNYAEAFIKGFTDMDGMVVDDKGINGTIRGNDRETTVSTKLYKPTPKSRLTLKITLGDDDLTLTSGKID